VPIKELSGAIMQVEKYIYYLNKWARNGEDILTQRYQSQLPGIKIKITNPCGMIIMGRDSSLTFEQMQDFEIIKRKYKSVVDIITYDDLIRRLDLLIKKFS
jgi:hypothetical protein